METTWHQLLVRTTFELEDDITPEAWNSVDDFEKGEGLILHLTRCIYLALQRVRRGRGGIFYRRGTLLPNWEEGALSGVFWIRDPKGLDELRVALATLAGLPTTAHFQHLTGQWLIEGGTWVELSTIFVDYER